MTLQPAENIGGGDYLDLKSMISATGGPVLAVCRIVSYAPHGVPAQGTGWTGTNYPVRADVLICNGPGTGEAHLGEEFITGAITKTLRGVANPRSPGEPLAPPRYPIGHELGVKFEIKNAGAPNAFVVANGPDAAEFAAISAVYAGGQGWANAQAAAARAQAVQQAPVAQWPAPAAAAFTPPAPAQSAPVGPTPEQLAQFAAWQAQQQAAAAPPASPAAPGLGGAPTDAPWNTSTAARVG